MAYGYTCGSCGDGSASAAGGSGQVGQDLAGIYDPGVLSVGEALAARGYYEPAPFGVTPPPPPAPPTTLSGLLTLAAVAIGAALLL